MGKRPLCVALVIVIGGILLSSFLTREASFPVMKGEQKTLVCQVTDIIGQGDSISLNVCDVYENNNSFCGKMKVYNGSKENLFCDVKIGNVITIQGEVYSFSRPGNPGQFNEYAYYREQDISYRMFAQSLTIRDLSYQRTAQFLHELRNTFFNQLKNCLEEDQAGIVAAMVLGEKSALIPEVKELYQDNGIAHVLAISGVKTANLVSPIIAESGLKWAFVRVHIAKKYIQNLCFKGHNQITCPSRFRGG